KKDVIQYPHFIKLIIADLIKKFPSISQRLKEDYHSIKDDILLVSIYSTGNVLFQGMRILDAFLTDEIRATDDYAEYETVFVKKKRKQFAGETSSPRNSLKVTINQKKPMQEKLEKEKIAKMVEGDEDEESYGSEFADSMLNDDDDSGTRIERGSHKEHSKNVVDDDESEKEKKDDKKDDEKANDDEKKDETSILIMAQQIILDDQLKKDVIQYPRFIKLIIADLIKKFPSIPQRLKEDYHSIKDDILLVSIYSTGNVLFQGMRILDAFLTDEIRATDDYAEYETVFVKKLEKEKIAKMVEGDEDEESYGSEFVDSMLNDDDDSGTRIERGSHKEHSKNVVDDDESEKEKKDDKKDDEKANDDEKKDETVHSTTSMSTSTKPSADLQQQLYLKMNSNLQDQVADPTLWDVLKCKFEKFSTSTTSCRDDAFRPHHHDDHHEDDAPPEGEKRAKIHKTSKSSKSTRILHQSNQQVLMFLNVNNNNKIRMLGLS
nr:hypothetical protein [Tanacetum cinerariifolium]